MYFPDLSEFSYLKFSHPKDLPENLKNIGWLDKEHEYSKGNLAPEALDIIKKIIFLERNLNLTRGYFFCPFCDNGNMPIEVEFAGKEKYLGSGIIVIKCKENNYAFPNLVYHYIKEHKYLPPKVFIDDISYYYQYLKSET